MGKNSGKTVGKVAFTVAGFFVGGMNPAMFGATKFLPAAIMGASLGGTLWTLATARRNSTKSGSLAQKFDKAMNTVTSTGAIQVVYGTRLVEGNQTYHKPSPELNMLDKHVVLCEGGIGGLLSVMAAGLPIPIVDGDSSDNGGVIFMIGNIKHSDAKVTVSKHKMYLKHGSETFKTIKLGDTDDYDDTNFAQYELDIASMVSYINRIGEGWIAFPFASTNKLPHDIYDNTDYAKGKTYYTYHDGDLPENYGEVGSYKGCAWLDMHFTVSDELNGNPNIDTVVQGRKVYDTRTKETVFSTNPAMCLRDFLLNEVFGVGWKGGLDEDSFKEAADYCDELIEYVDSDGELQKRKRYELNLILNEQEDAEDAVAKFLSACCGFLIRYKGTIGMKIEKPTAVSYHFTEDQIVKDSFNISQIGLDETPNRYILNIISPEQNWRATRCIVEDTAMQEATGIIQEESVDLDGVTSYQQALRIGRLYRDLNTVCNKVISFSTASQAMHLQPGDVVLVSYYRAIEEMPFRIISMKEEANGTFTIEGREYCESIYSDAIGAVIHAGKYTSVSLGDFNAKIKLRNS